MIKTSINSFRNFYLVILVCFLANFTSCDSPGKEESDDSSSENKLDVNEELFSSITYKYLEFGEKDCSEPCGFVTINYPSVPDEKIQGRIMTIATSEMENYLRDTKGLSSIEDYAVSFNSLFKDFKATFPETSTPWTLEIDIEITFQTKSWFSIKKSVEAYTGGAHANTTVEYLLYGEDGNRFSHSKLITNRKKLLTILEDQFRKDNKIGQDQNWEETNYMFEDGNFEFPENIGFSNKGMVFFYNNYETASYAQGSTEILLPYEKIKDCVAL